MELRKLLVTGVLVTAVPFARADTDAEDPPPPPHGAPASADQALGVDHERDPHWIGEVGMRIGGSSINGVDNGTVDELLLAGGLHRDRMTLLGEYGASMVQHEATSTSDAVLGTTSAVPGVTTKGTMHRFGLDARYAFARTSSTPLVSDHDHQLVGELFVQAGAGLELVQWDLGGRIVRPELSVEVGMLGAYRTSARRRDGWFVALRFQVDRRFDLDGAGATCSAPCTAETPPVAWGDRSYMLETGFVFGD